MSWPLQLLHPGAYDVLASLPLQTSHSKLFICSVAEVMELISLCLPALNPPSVTTPSTYHTHRTSSPQPCLCISLASSAKGLAIDQQVGCLISWYPVQAICKVILGNQSLKYTQASSPPQASIPSFTPSILRCFSEEDFCGECGVPEKLASANITNQHVSNRGLDMKGAVSSVDEAVPPFRIYMTFSKRRTFTEDDAFKYFSAYGRVKQVSLPYQGNCDYGFVTFSDSNAVKRVLEKENPHIISKDRILVKPYKKESKPTSIFKSCRKPIINSEASSIQQNANITESSQGVLKKAVQQNSSGELAMKTQFANFQNPVVGANTKGCCVETGLFLENNDVSNILSDDNGRFCTRNNSQMRPNKGVKVPPNSNPQSSDYALDDESKCDMCHVEAGQLHKYTSCKHGYCSICRIKIKWIPMVLCPICFLWEP